MALEEGALDRWFFGCTVLAGDDIHKVITALSGNRLIHMATILGHAKFRVKHVCSNRGCREHCECHP